MGNKKRIIFLIFAAGLALALALGILYSWMAFMPTGYEEFHKTAEAARERIKRKTALGADAATSATIDQAPVGYTVGHNGKSGPPHKLDFFEELATFDSYKHLISGDINRNYVGGGFATPSEPIYFMAPRRRQLVGTTVFIDKKSVMGKSLWAGLEQERRDSVMRMRSGFRRVTLTTPTTEQVRFFNQYLDKFERFLLRPRWNVPAEGIYPGNFLIERLALFAIARASMSGDQGRAMAILDGYLKAQGVLLARASAGPSVTELFFGLAELPDFPAEGWLRARRALDAMRLAESDIADMRRVCAEDFFNGISAELTRGDFQKMGNMWHFLYGGKIESIANTALLPVALRKAEQMALSISRADTAACEREQSELRAIMGLMNSRDSRIDQYYEMRSKIVSISETNDRIDGALLILDAACAMRDGKPLPALSRRGRQQLEQITMPRFGTFELGQSWMGPPPAELASIISALNQYAALHPNSIHPATPEEIKAFIKENGGGGWEKYVDWHDARPVCLVWGPSCVSAYLLNRYSEKQYPDPDQFVERTQLKAFALDPPIISGAMKKLLERPVQSAPKRSN
ncbi:MAG: hypothetical protein ABFD69_01935 [Candidatus Sumerlaeia bacterium]